MPPIQNIIPIGGVDVNTDESYLSERMASFLRNINFQATNNTGVPAQEGGNELVMTPLMANEKYAGINLDENNSPIGFFEHEELNHAYVFVHNRNGNHRIYRIHGATGYVETVIVSSLLNFQLDPRYFIAEGRCVAEIRTRINPSTGQQEQYTLLIFTDFFQDIFMISVEDAIYTNGFSATDLPYFVGNFDRKDYLRLGLAEPKGNVEITPIPRPSSDPSELSKSNLLIYQVWQWRVRYIDVWGRYSEYGAISDAYTPSSGSNCLSKSSGISRSVSLQIPAGSPIVDKIELLFRNSTSEGSWTDWYLYDTIDKYNDCEDKRWYERSMRSSLIYNSATNSIQYIFSGDRERVPVDQTAIRLESYLPLTASSVLRMNRRITLMNTKRGFQPLDCDQTSKLALSVYTPPATACSLVKSHKVSIYAVIYNPYERINSYVCRIDKNSVFGIINCSGSGVTKENNPMTYKQTFPKDQDGWIGYMAGTKIMAISKQYHLNVMTGEEVYVGHDHHSPDGLLNGIISPDTTFVRIVQKWEFDLPPGEYVFRIAGHRSEPSEDYAKSSTYLFGKTRMTDPDWNHINQEQEVVINVVDQDIVLRETPFLIFDLMNGGKGCAVGDRTSVVEGYIYEDEINKIPLELLQVNKNTGLCIYRELTDHNGHYFISTKTKGLHAILRGMKNGVPNTILATGSQTKDNPNDLYKFDRLYAYRGEVAYPANDRTKITGRVTLCDNDAAGVPGIVVVLTNGQAAATDADGKFTIIAHDIGNTTNRRSEKVIITQKGICTVMTCGEGCNYTLPHYNATMPAFVSGQERLLNVGTVQVKVTNVNAKGPQKGGRYGIGIVARDWLGRKSFVEMSDKHYVDIPTIQQTGNYEYSQIRYALNGMRFPQWVTEISFYATDNLNFDDFLSWAVDRIQLVDVTGKTNNVAPTAIRIYYEGLREYNKQKLYATNTSWDVVGEGVDIPIAGDLIEFITKGDGTILPPGLVALVQYDKDGKYLQIDYSDDFKEVNANTLFRLYRPRKTNEKRFYYEVPGTIPVQNGIPATETGVVNIIDSYLQARQIPVPVETQKITTDADGNEVTTSEIENQVRSYLFPFEHHSPADTWGSHASNRGRGNIVNPYARERHYRSEIIRSAAVVPQAEWIGLHYFKAEDAVQMDEQEFGAIVIGIAEINTLLVICELDNYVLGFDDARLYMTQSGQIATRSEDQSIGRPERKIGSNFGCQPWEINTIRKIGGQVFFVDAARRCLVVHDFSAAKNIIEQTLSSWFFPMLIHLQDSRRNGERLMYLHAGVDPKKGEYLLSKSYLYPRPHENIVQLPTANINGIETLACTYRPGDESARFWFYSFVPAYYGSLIGDKNDKQLITFVNGNPWYHYDVNTQNPRFLQFYGVQVEPWVEVVFNIEPSKHKVWGHLEVVCNEMLLYADRIETEAGQLSRIMPRWWNRFDKKYAAAFLCAINSMRDNNLGRATAENALLDGEQLHGRWVKVRFTQPDKHQGKYFEVMLFAAAAIGN